VRAQTFYTLARIISIYCSVRSSAMPEVAESTSSNKPWTLLWNWNCKNIWMLN